MRNLIKIMKQAVKAEMLELIKPVNNGNEDTVSQSKKLNML